MKKLLTVLLVLVIGLYGEATIVASDNAANAAYGDGWTTNDNGGSGFGAWQLSTNTPNGGAGFYIGNPGNGEISGMSTSSFGLWANPQFTSDGPSANADRSFSNALEPGQIFSFQLGINWDAGWTSGVSGSKGFNLYTGGTSGSQLLNINMGGTEDIYITDESDVTTLMFDNYGTAVMTINIEMKNSTTLRVYAIGRDGSESYDQDFTISGAPDAFRFYAFNLYDDSNEKRQPYFDQLTITEPDGQVPITLTSFSAAALNGSVSVTWVTESESENAHFRLYRDGEVLAQIAGAGTTSEPHHYAYTDRYVAPGRTYSYQLADVSFDGEETKHARLEVEVKAEGVDRDYNIGPAYPNPFNPTTIVPLNLAKDALVNATLYDISGRPLKELHSGTLSAGSHDLKIDGTDLSTGIYVVHVSVNNVVNVQKIALMK
jgi:hypothetical protein